MTKPSADRKRAPVGVDTERPIALRLMPRERKVIEKMAASQDKSLNAVSRDLVVFALGKKGIAA